MCKVAAVYLSTRAALKVDSTEAALHCTAVQRQRGSTGPVVGDAVRRVFRRERPQERQPAHGVARAPFVGVELVHRRTGCGLVCCLQHGAQQLPASLQVHGWLNAVGLGLLLPLAAAIARTLREHPNVRPPVHMRLCTLVCGLKWLACHHDASASADSGHACVQQVWFNMHRSVASLGYALGVAGIGACLCPSAAVSHSLSCTSGWAVTSSAELHASATTPASCCGAPSQPLATT